RFSVVTLTGPPFAGALFGLGRSLPFLADAISYVFSIVSLLGMRTPFQEERERDPASLRVQIREGFSFLWQQPFLRTCALIFAGDNFVFQGLYLTLVVVARRHGLSSAAIGAMIAVFGAVQLVGALLAPRMAKRLTMRTLVLLGQWVVAAAIAFLVVRSPYVLLATALPMALVGPWTNAAIIGYRTAVTPDRLVGRVSSVARNIALLAQPLGPLAAGLLISAWSPWTATLVLVAIGTALAVWASVSPSIRQAPSLDELDADTALA
ncbi:MAG TPA: MFS transporter, partial [Gaiellaceae bacterium]|nr:MFS transporter [Gaiellaceae bacterium]